MFTITIQVGLLPDGKPGFGESIAVPAGQRVTRGDIADIYVQLAAEHSKHRPQAVLTVPERDALRAAKEAADAAVKTDDLPAEAVAALPEA